MNSARLRQLMAVGFLVHAVSAADLSAGGLSNPGAPGPSFPPSEGCTSFSPCTNMTGVILKIEDDSYWLHETTGMEVHLKVTPESSMGEIPTVGDHVLVQVSSTGDVMAIQQIDEVGPSERVRRPATTYRQLR